MNDNFRILLIENDDHVRDLVKLVLEEEGFRVQANSARHEKLEGLLSFKPHLILLDVSFIWASLPEFVLTCREKLGNSVPIIGLSTSVKIAEQAQAIGIDMIIGKPFDLDDLILGVKSCLNANV